MKKVALIVGGGSGTRMGTDIPKQFLLLNGVPVIVHTIRKFEKVADEVYLVLPESQFGVWEEMRKEFKVTSVLRVFAGGSSRTASVWNGLKEIEGKGVVAIHDAVRPLVSVDCIRRIFDTAVAKGNAIPVVPVKESMRRVQGELNEAVDRVNYRIVQTPQCFDIELIKKSYLDAGANQYTDDASVAEQAGHVMYLVEGEEANIKITYPGDLLFAETLLKA